jgi:arylsulfatase A-like enzyme
VKQVLPNIYAGILGGLGAGIWVLAGELCTLSGDLGPGLALALAGVVLPAFLFGGLLAALALLFLRRAGRGVARLLGRFGAGDRGAVLLLALGAMPVLFLLVQRLAAGRKAAQIIGPLYIRLAITVGLALLGALVLWGGLRVARALQRRNARGAWLVAAVALLALTTALLLADAFLYRRLYEYIHMVLLACYLLAGLLGILALWRALRADRPAARRWPLPAATAALAVAALAGGWGARSILTREQRLRFATLEQTTVATKILAILPLQTSAEAPLFLESSVDTPSRPKGGHKVPGANVVLVSVDALRADHIGIYGYRRPITPNIDALARSAMRFEHAYCQAPLTCYSVPSLLTGDYLKSTLPLLSKTPPTLARILAAQGYTTAAFYNASIFFCDDKKATSYGDRHFDFAYAETQLRDAAQLTDNVLAYLQRFNESGKRKLFLWVHYFDAHEPYHRHPEHDFGTRSIDLYDGEIAFVDRAIGRLVASLNELQGPTIFVLTADHGEEFKEHGGNYHGSSLYEEQIRVPLVIGVPGLKNGVAGTPVQLVDIAPTLLSLLGIRIPASVRGASLVPELLNKGAPDRCAFSEVHTKKMVRFRQWKLIHDYRRSTFELYDLLTDRGERHNLIGQRPRDAAQLKGLLHRWFDRLRAVGGRQEEDRPDGIDLGRIGDRRAVPLLAQLLDDPGTPSRWRQEAAQLLGQLQDAHAAEALWLAVADDDKRVAEEAAIALGEIKNRLARFVLPEALDATDTELRMRAAIALARVDSPQATPALIEALYSDNWEIQNRAAHYLGFVGDRRAIEPLLRMSTRLHLRSRIALALGRIGRRFPDRRLLPFLLDRVKNDPHAEVRQRALGGIGFMGDRRAIRPLAAILASEPELTWTAETISRLNGIGWYWVPGVDFTPQRRGLREGWGRCVDNPSQSTDDYLDKTWCPMIRSQASIQLQLHRKPFAAQLILRYRGTPALRGRTLELKVNGKRLAPLSLSGGWRIARIRTAASLWRQGANTVRFRVVLPKPPPQRDANAELAAIDYLVLAGAARHHPRRGPRQ